jgi:hypothetical protein
MFLGNISQTRPSKRISAVNNTRRAECRQDQRITALEKEVNRLRKSLTQELSLRNALNRGFHRALGSLPRIPNNLPVQTRKLLFEVAILEEEVVSLEKQAVRLWEELEQDLYSRSHSSHQTIAGTLPSNFASKISSPVLQNVRESLHTHWPHILAARSSELRSSDRAAGIPAAKHILIASVTNLEEAYQTPAALENLCDQAGTNHVSKEVLPPKPEVSSRFSSSDLEALAPDMPANGPTKPCAVKHEDGRHPFSVTQTQLKSKDFVVAKMLSSIQATKSTLRGHNRSASEVVLPTYKPLNKIA